MRYESLFILTFQKTGYQINKVLVLAEFCDFKLAAMKW